MGFSSRAVGLQKSFLYNSRLEVRQVLFFQLQAPEVFSEISIFAGLWRLLFEVSRALGRVSFLLQGLQGFLLDPDAVGIFRGGNGVL
jgi:hypothetical protein